MSKVNIKYAFKQMIEQGFSYFTIKDMAGQIVMQQRNDDMSPQGAVDAIKDFMKHSDGMFQIEARTKNPGVGNNGIRRHFTVSTEDLVEERKPRERHEGISGHPGPYDRGNVSQRDFLSLYEEAKRENEKLHRELQEAKLTHLKDLNEANMKFLSLQNDFNREKESDKITGLATSVLGSMFGGGMTPSAPAINGIGDNSPEVDLGISPAEEARLEQALKTLAANDPNFVSNLEKLAKLCSSNKAMYDQGVQMIGNLT
jgi:hypothetical protein